LTGLSLRHRALIERAREPIVAAVFFVLAVVMTWPLGRVWEPVLPDLNDAHFNVWRLAWVAHQLRTDPTHLFDANIFAPVALTLAYSDAMLLLGIVAAPLIWLGVHAYAVHNLLAIAAFWSAAYGTYRVSFAVSGSVWPSVAGGVIGGFAPYRFGHIAHLELLWTAFIALTALAFIRLFERPCLATSVRLAACVVLQTLCSIYYGVFLAIALVLASVGLLLIRAATLPRLRALAIAGVIALVALAPYARPYVSVSRTVEPRSASEIESFSATPADYLRTARDNLLQFGDSDEVREERSLYPGAIAVALAIVGFAARSRAAWVAGAALAVTFDLSLGTHGIAYPALLRLLPFLDGLRAPSRFAAFFILALAVLAALGLQRLVRVRRIPRWGVAVVLAGMTTEYWAAPITTRSRPTEAPPLYAWLAQQERAIVLELPLPPGPGELWGYENEYQLMSIFHWQPLLNGYSGNAPPQYLDLLTTMKDFPSPASIETLRRRSTKWVVLHQSLVGPSFSALLSGLTASQAFRQVATFHDGQGEAAVLEVLHTGM
jgi:hypothetical protein